MVLGCTHYPFVSKTITRILGTDVEIFDGGPGTAKEMKRRLEEAGLLRQNAQKQGKIDFENSDKSQQKKDLFYKLLNY